jgi:hypothetical protein
MHENLTGVEYLRKAVIMKLTITHFPVILHVWVIRQLPHEKLCSIGKAVTFGPVLSGMTLGDQAIAALASHSALGLVSPAWVAAKGRDNA